MFLPCPNCGFLVALVKPKNSATEQRCPRCGHVLAGAPIEEARPVAAAVPAAPVATHQVGSRAGRLAGSSAVQPSAHHAEPAREIPDSATAGIQPGNAEAGPADGPGRRARLAPVVPSVRPESQTEASPVHPQPVAAPPAVHGRRAPSFARRRARAASRPPRWPLYLASGALALLLALQLVLAQRGALAADARWRPSLDALCGVLGCSVPPWREPSAFTMLDRSVQPKPGAVGVLDARASFRNDARWPQPWPTLVLTLSGVDGEPLGARAFAPAEYADRPDAVLAPGETASVQLDVIEPGPGVVAFAFDFH